MNTKSATRRVALSAALMAVVAGGFASPAGASQSAVDKGVSRQSAKAPLAVGGWSGIVQREEVTDRISVWFYTDGTLCLITTGGSFLGSWSSDSRNQLSWEAVESLPGGAGHVYVDQDGIVSQHTILTQGITRVEDPNGAPIGSVEATVLLGRDNTVIANCS